MTETISKCSMKRAWAWIPSLYFAEGMPNAIVVTISVLMYKNLGVSNSETALFTSLIYLAWVIKPLWSPFIDIFQTKRKWILLMQLLLAFSCFGVAIFLNTPWYIVGTLIMFTLMALVSATHDIAADGFYIVALTEHQQSFFVGFRNVFYKLATVLALLAGTKLSGMFMNSGMSASTSWTFVIGGIGAVFFLFAVAHYFSLPKIAADHGQPHVRAVDVWREFGLTFSKFFQKKGIGIALLFILLYRLPESLLTKMIIPFLVDPVADGGLGLSNETVGVTYGVFGTLALLAGGLIGGITISRFGLKKMLLPMAAAMSVTCLTFVLLSILSAPSQILIDVCVAVEQFGYGFGFSAYMLYLIYFSRGKMSTAHYAICTGFMAAGLMIPGAVAGYIQEWLGYTNFFILTIITCAVTIAVTLMVKIDPHFGKKAKS